MLNLAKSFYKEQQKSPPLPSKYVFPLVPTGDGWALLCRRMYCSQTRMGEDHHFVEHMIVKMLLSAQLQGVWGFHMYLQKCLHIRGKVWLSLIIYELGTLRQDISVLVWEHCWQTKLVAASANAIWDIESRGILTISRYVTALLGLSSLKYCSLISPHLKFV